MPESAIRAVVVDDEPLARQRIVTLLKEQDNVDIAGECSDGRQAVESILNTEPDLVFLDIQMPELNGFEVILTIGLEHMPVVVFVTAYDKYAIRAFDVHAVDYLLKPFDRPRFQAALDKALKEIHHRRSERSTSDLRALLSTVRDDPRVQDRILVKSAGKVSIIRTDQVDWIESAGNYVNLHVGKETHLLRETMKGMEDRLDPRLYARIHRTTIVNMDRITELRPHFHGDYVVFLRDGTRLMLSRRYRTRLSKMIGEL